MLDLAHKAGKQYHENLYNAFVKNITEILVNEGVPSSIANQIHCVAAGLCDEEEKERFIWYASNKTNTKNDEKVDFLPELWAVIFEVLTGKSRETFFASSRTKKATNTAEQQQYMKDLEQKLEQERRARREQELQQQRLQQQMRAIQQQRLEQERRAEEARWRAIQLQRQRQRDDDFCNIL